MLIHHSTRNIRVYILAIIGGTRLLPELYSSYLKPWVYTPKAWLYSCSRTQVMAQIRDFEYIDGDHFENGRKQGVHPNNYSLLAYTFEGGLKSKILGLRLSWWRGCTVSLSDPWTVRSYTANNNKNCEISSKSHLVNGSPKRITPTSTRQVTGMQRWINVWPPSATLAQHWFNISRVCGKAVWGDQVIELPMASLKK